MRRILYVTSHWPLGRTSGSQLRCLQVARALKDAGKVHLAVVEEAEDNPDPDRMERSAAEFEVALAPKVLPASNLGIAGKMRRALDPRCPYPDGWAADAESQAKLSGLMNKFEVVWFFKIRTASMFSQWNWPRSVMDIDDIPSEFTRRSLPAHGLQRINALAKVKAQRRREALLDSRFNVLCVCSEADRRFFGGSPRVHVIPNGFERPLPDPVWNPTTPPRIGFIGLLEYPPNELGVRWFLRECWPGIKQRIPDCRFRLVGKQGLQSFQGPDVDSLGWVVDPSEEISTWSAMIVPIQRGAGTRVKIATGFSRKCPVVSTSFGAMGYAVENVRDLLLADDGPAFARSCTALITDRDGGRQMAERAWKLFLEKFTWQSIAPAVHQAVDDCLRSEAARP